MNKSIIVSGEASETESEEECVVGPVNVMTKSVQGAVITGEDSESDTEIDKTIAGATPRSNAEEVSESCETKYDSLFHQKLREHNNQLSNSLENIAQNTINDATKQLNSIDQNLLRSQITMQNAVTSLKSLSINSLSIKSKLHSLLSSKFLSNVTVNK